MKISPSYNDYWFQKQEMTATEEKAVNALSNGNGEGVETQQAVRPTHEDKSDVKVKNNPCDNVTLMALKGLQHKNPEPQFKNN